MTDTVRKDRGMELESERNLEMIKVVIRNKLCIFKLKVSRRIKEFSKIERKNKKDNFGNHKFS